MVNSRNIESQGRNSNRRLSNHFVKKEDREEVRVDAVELYNSLWSGNTLQLGNIEGWGKLSQKPKDATWACTLRGAWAEAEWYWGQIPNLTWHTEKTQLPVGSEVTGTPILNIKAAADTLGLAWVLELAVPTCTNWPDAHGWPECLIWSEWPHKIWTLDTIILRLSSQDHFAI